MITDEEHVYVEAARHFWRIEGRELTSLAKGIGALLALWALGVGVVHLVALLPASHPKPTYYGPVKPAKLPVYKPAVLSADTLLSTSTTATNTPPVVGQPTTFTVTVTPSDATGRIGIEWGSDEMCLAPVINGVGSCSYTFTSPGPYLVTAEFQINTVYAASFENLSLNVTAPPDPVSASAPPLLQS